MEDNLLKSVKDAAEKHRPELLRKPNVRAVGHGFKRKGGKLTGIPCVKVYVDRKLPLSAFTADTVVPAQLEGISTDVEEIRIVDALAVYAGKKRPAPGGYSVGHLKVTAGSIGLPLVRKDGLDMLLTNTHIAAPHYAAEVKQGDAIVQPGIYDYGDPATDRIGALFSWIPIEADKDNQVDGALVHTLPGLVDFRIEGSPQVYERIGAPSLGQMVIKTGRTTGLTRGKVTAIDMAVLVRYTDTLMPLFTGQIEIEPESPHPAYILGGDSGSITLSEDGREAIGLNFAGSAGTGFANRMDRVQELLGFEIVPRPQPDDIADQVKSLGDALLSVYGYSSGEWTYYAPGHPDSSLKALQARKGYWVNMAKRGTLKYRGAEYELSRGWNLIGWTG